MLLSFICTNNNVDNTEQRCIAIDLGGSNLQILLVKIINGKIESERSLHKVPNDIKEGEGEALFNYIARKLKKFLDKNYLFSIKVIPLGFTFSYPCINDGLNSATLITS